MGLGKDVLLSVRPQYANLLVDGVKTIELRRKFPTDLAEGTRCLIYSTSPIQKVIGECKIKSVEKLPISELWKHSADNAMIPWSDFSNYFGDLEHGYAVHVYGYIRYADTKSLCDITGADTRPPQSYRYLPNRNESAML